MEQRSDEWFSARAGKVTASRFADACSFTAKGVSTAARNGYIRELAFERLTGRPMHRSEGLALRWGTEAEQFARAAYEESSGVLVAEVGLLLMPEFDFIGCSPDGLIGQDGGIEIKCPHDEAKHVLTMLEGVPDEHKWQIQGAMMITGRSWWDFVSYDPRQIPGLQLYVERVYRDAEFIKSLLRDLIAFNVEVDGVVSTLEARGSPSTQR